MTTPTLTWSVARCPSAILVASLTALGGARADSQTSPILDGLGDRICPLNDVDGDGIVDYAIGSNGGVDGVYPGCVTVFSGKSGSKLYSLWKSDFFREQR
jgi:hypothetical protein